MAKEFTLNKIAKICEFNAKIYIAAQEYGRGNYNRGNHVAARMQVHAGVYVSQVDWWISSPQQGECRQGVKMRQFSSPREKQIERGPALFSQQQSRAARERLLTL